MWQKAVTFDIGTAQCEDGTIKCDVLVTWYNRLLTSGYRTPKKRGGYRRITLFAILSHQILSGKLLLVGNKVI